MRLIKYKASNSGDFVDYVDIGCCERDYYSINFYIINHQETTSGKRHFDSYSDWFKTFKKEPIGSKMLILSFYLSEFIDSSMDPNNKESKREYFNEVYGVETSRRIEDNLNYLIEFINTWFYIGTSIFKGLDLNYDEIDYRVNRFTECGEIAEIELADGSIVIFPDEDDRIRSFYVSIEAYDGLQKEIKKIEKIFQP